MHIYLLTFLIVVALHTAGQTHVFEKYPFEKGGYTILGISNELWPNTIQSQLGEFFTDDIIVLNQLKKTWVFTSKKTLPGHKQDHLYHYVLVILYRGEEKEFLSINLDSGIIVTSYGSYSFDTNKLKYLVGKVKKVVAREYTFASFKEGKTFEAEAKKNPKYLISYEWGWEDFQGSFMFDYKSTDNPDLILKRLNQYIATTYPNEAFKLEFFSAAPRGEYGFNVNCNKSLYDKFKMKKSGWKYSKFSLTSYWKK